MIPGNHGECVNTTRITQSPGLDEFGVYNSFPEPAREINVDTFTKHILRRGLRGTESRQPKDLNYATLVIFWLSPGYGVGVSQRWCDSGWESVYWFFGCEHKLVEQVPTQFQGDMIHEYVCEHCGYGITIDSSG